MSRSTALLAIALAALLVTAGCLGGIAGTEDGANDRDGTNSDEASVSFYVSDRPGAIDQFEHLNVTITSVGFHQADEGGDEDDESDESDDSDDGDGIENETTDTEDLEDANETATQTETNATTEAPETEDDDSENSTATESDEGDDSDDSDESDESDDSEEDDSEDGESDGWVTHEVDNRTVDLTELQGANASRLVDFNISAGEYDKVFVHVSEVEGTLNNGEQVNVRLPSDKLQINKRFTAESGSNLSFVFDIMVHEAGNSGQYILRPVVGESGTGDQVEIRDVDDDDRRGPPEDAGPQNDDDDSDSEDTDESDDSDDSDLELAVDGQVRAGETVTLTVTGADDAAVANATVAVDGETVGTTAADGTIELTVPEDGEELEVTVTTDGSEAEHSWPVRGNGGGNGLMVPV